MDLNFDTMTITERSDDCPKCHEPGKAISQVECEEAWKAAMLLVRFYRQLGKAVQSLDEKLVIEKQRRVVESIESQVRTITFCVQAQIAWREAE